MPTQRKTANPWKIMLWQLLTETVICQRIITTAGGILIYGADDARYVNRPESAVAICKAMRIEKTGAPHGRQTERITTVEQGTSRLV